MSANKRPRNGDTEEVSKVPQSEDSVEQKARKACINCRRQKMKCVIKGANSSCARCQRSGLPCIFLPRANAATLPECLLNSNTCNEAFQKDVVRRLEAIEQCIGLCDYHNVDGAEAGSENSDDENSSQNNSLKALWHATEVLKRSAPNLLPSYIWQKRTVKELWASFHDRMPGLHFMPRKQTFSRPHPILLASILYCSSSRGPPSSIDLAPHYFTVLSNAIAQLCIPGSEIGRVPEIPEEWAFQTVLGIILAGLLSEAKVCETGIWISVAYRLILEHCPTDVDDTAREWRNLFSGVQIIDLEHASLHLSCPVIPIESPLPALQTSYRAQLYRLSRMMHTGLTHFTGRGLPTIWSCFNNSPRVNTAIQPSTFTAVDAAIIRDWARQLDEWLIEFSQRFDGSEQDRQLVFRQYVLHRLVVLSIYHPARGCDLWSNNITPMEQQELLLSARATLKLHLKDQGIWSNWDLVMITWAALIVIQGIEGGAGEVDGWSTSFDVALHLFKNAHTNGKSDLDNIRVHLEMMKRMNGPNLGLCDKLIIRLEESLCGVHTPDSAVLHENGYNNAVLEPDMNDSWQIFDQASLQQMIYPGWPTLDQVTLTQ